MRIALSVIKANVGSMSGHCVGAAMLPMAELEYTGITERLATLDQHFRIRG